MNGDVHSSANSTLLLLLVTSSTVIALGRHPGHQKRQLSDPDSSCPEGCVCQLAGDHPCDWCAQNTASAGAVSCEGCGYDETERPTAGGLDRAATATAITCHAAGYDQVPRGFPSTAITVDLSENSLETLGPPSRLRYVINLRLRGNKIRRVHEHPSSHPSHSAPLLQVLDLSGNQLAKIDAQSFDGLESLLHLDLSSNNIEEIDDGALSRLRRLSRLDLRYNQLTRITASTLRGLSSLRYLLLTGNHIELIDRRAFRSLEGLVYVVLKGNPITGQPVRFQFHSSLLTYLDLSECDLPQVPKGLPGSTRYAQLRRNNITSLSRTSFIESPFVSILVLDDNDIGEVDEQAFRPLRQLQQLWMSGNRLRSVPFGLPASLQRLLLDFNRIDNLTDVFSTDSQLNTLSLTGNHITSISTDAFSKLQHLRSIDLSNNRLRQISVDTFTSQQQLRLLQLSGNPIEVLPAGCFRGLGQLSVLALAYVSTDEVVLDDATFDDVARSLTRLEADSSPGLLRAMMASDAVLVALGGVADFSARSSDLVTVRSDLPLFLSASAVRLSSARWRCDRGLVWLRDWLRSAEDTATHASAKASLAAIAEENRCAWPRRLAGRKLFSVADNEFDASTAPPFDRQISENGTTSTPLFYNSYRTTSVSSQISQSDQLESSLDRHPVPVDDSLYQHVEDIQKMPVYRRIHDGDLLDLSTPELTRFSGENVGNRKSDREVNQATAAPLNDLERLAETEQPKASRSFTTLVAIGATIGVTVVIVTIILVVIYRLVRGQKPSRSGSADREAGTGTYGKDVIKHEQRNGTLYFMPAGNGDCMSAPTSRTRLDLTLNSSATTAGESSVKSVGEISTLLANANKRELAARATNSGEPLRMYKWEDF